MQKDVSRRLDIMEHALGWSRNYPPSDPAHQRVIERLAGLVAQVAEAGRAKAQAEAEDLAAVRRRNTLRRQIQQQYLRHLVRVGRVVARATGEITVPARLPRTNISHDAFLDEARLMQTLATRNRELLEAHGLGGRFMEELSERITRLEEYQGEINGARSRHIEARFTLIDLARRGMELVRVLDGLVALQFREQPALIAGWQSVHRPPGYGVRHRQQEGEAA